MVTGVYEPLPLEEADRTVTSIPVEDQRLLANTLTDFLRLEPSLDLRQRAPNGIQGDLSIRGATFGQSLILVDGLRLNDPQTGHHSLNLPVALDAVSRVEILKGSGSTLYGSDAVGGVVNFVTRVPRSSEFRLRTAAGNFGVNEQRASIGAARGRFSQYLTLSRDFSSGFRPDRDYRNLSASSISHLATLLGDTHLLLAHADRPFGADQFYGNFNSWERTRIWFASLRQAFGKKTEASVAFRRHTDLFVLYRDRPQIFTNRHAVESWQGALRRREELSRTARLFFGAEGYRDAIASSNLGAHARVRTAGYVNLDVRALRRFSMSLGVRREVHGSFDGQTSPTLAAGVWLSSHVKLRSSLSHAFRLPSYTELYYHDPASQGSRDLRPERAGSYEAGMDWNGGGRFRGGVAVFHRRDTDGIDFIRRSSGEVWRAANIQRLRFTGLEVTAGAVLRRVHEIELRYAGLRGTGSVPVGMFSRYVFNYPSHSGIVSWRGALPAGLAARARVGVTRRLGQNPYTVADLYIARLGGRLSPFVQLTNLSGASYQEIAGVPMPGRGIAGGIELTIFGRLK